MKLGLTIHYLNLKYKGIKDNPTDDFRVIEYRGYLEALSILFPRSQFTHIVEKWNAGEDLTEALYQLWDYCHFGTNRPYDNDLKTYNDMISAREGEYSSWETDTDETIFNY